MDGTQEWKNSITDEEIIEGSYKLYKESKDREFDVRNDMLDDIQFENGQGHWGNVRGIREADDRPCLVVPRLNQFLNIVRNEARQNKPSIKVSARGSLDGNPGKEKQREEAAKLRQGLIRFLQYSTKATQAYQMAYDHATGCGRGWFRLREDYVDNKSMDKKIEIDMIKNPLSVFPGFHKEVYDYSDMKSCHIIETMTRDKFKEKYPKIAISEWDNSLITHDWSGDKEITVAEFYGTWIKKRKLCLVQPIDGDAYTAYKDEIEDYDKDFIIDSRTVNIPVIKWFKMTREAIIDRADIEGKFIPVIPVIGYEKDIAGRLEIKGMIRDAKDIARMYDYWVSTEAEYLTTQPKQPYLIAAGQIEGFEEYWEDINTITKSYAVYKETSVGGRLVPPPQRQMPAPIPSGLVNAKAATIDDMKAVLGMYAENLGEQGSERSGRAIIARQRQGDRANYHYIDNLGISLQHAAVIINQWLPVVYDGTRQEQILGIDDEPELVTLNTVNPQTQEEINLGDGEYDITVSMGVNFNNKRIEAAESMMEFVRAAPQFLGIMGDLFVKNMDWPGSDLIADRIRKTIPAHIIEKQGGEEQMAMQLQQAVQRIKQDEILMRQMSQQIQLLTAKVEDEDMKLTVEMQKAELDSKTKIAVAEINNIARSEESRRDRNMKIFEKIAQPVTTDQSLT